MDRKQELKQLYKETKTQAGVYQIKNNANHKILIESSPNLKTINGKKLQLEIGSHKKEQLQKEWNEYGKESFSFEVLEVLEEKEDGFFDLKDALEKLKKKWLDKLNPYGDQGYNKQP